ncbi:MAG: NAD(+) diphosphatase [Buchananella hordeovulneris]|nr:NAD(+) diphosphatase [Buchananella hordeovulneris]
MFSPVLSRSGFAKPYQDPGAQSVALADSRALVVTVTPGGQVQLNEAGDALAWAGDPLETDIFLGAALVDDAARPTAPLDPRSGGAPAAAPAVAGQENGAGLGTAGGNVGPQELAGRPLFVRVGEVGQGNWSALADVAGALSSTDCAAAVTGCALAAFHHSHRFCPTCGRPTTQSEQGWAQRCAGCQHSVFPRVDPAIIVSLRDEQDRILLARGPRHRPGWRSVIAGFVDAGESLEACVRREAKEEVGLTVTSLSYLTSQPWPFPRSLMLAFTARVEGEINIDGVEITDADFYTRAQVRALSASGELTLPRGASVARLLIESWLADQC